LHRQSTTVTERDNNEHPALTPTHALSGYDNIILGMPVKGGKAKKKEDLVNVGKILISQKKNIL